MRTVVPMARTHVAGIFVGLSFAFLCLSMLLVAAHMTGVGGEEGALVGPALVMLKAFVAMLVLATIAGMVEFFRYYSRNPDAK